MDDSTLQFYDGLSGDYHLLFEDWPKGVRWQGEVLDRLLRRLLGDRPLSILDFCCSIGTQAIGLALLGHRVHDTDLSPAAVERAAREATVFGVRSAPLRGHSHPAYRRRHDPCLTRATTS